MPAKPSIAYPCTECGYDLRATRGEVCPECGCKINRKLNTRSSIEQSNEQTAMDALADVRKGVDWTLVAWLGCIALPIAGQLAWVVLALVSGWRMIALGRLTRTEFLVQFNKHKWGMWLPQSMKFELGIAILGGLFTLVASMNTMPAALFALLVLIRLVWLGLVSWNNFSVGMLALKASEMLEGEAPHSAIRFLPLANFGAPILSIPFFLLSVIAEVVKIPGWINTLANLLLVIACILGIASVILIHTLLEQTIDAVGEDRRKRAIKRKRKVEVAESPDTAHLKQRIFPDPPPMAGEGDVIPFEDDSSGANRS